MQTSIDRLVSDENSIGGEMKRMTAREDLVQKIGEHVVSSFEAYTDTPVGNHVVVPAQIPRVRQPIEAELLVNLSDWIIRVSVGPPSLVLSRGPGDYQHLSLREALAYIEKLRKQSTMQV